MNLDLEILRRSCTQAEANIADAVHTALVAEHFNGRSVERERIVKWLLEQVAGELIVGKQIPSAGFVADLAARIEGGV